MKVRTRFAPSPTGQLHIGGLRTALYAYLFARQNGGDFILRLEDTDRVRLVEDAAQVIYDTLKAAGLQYDEGPDIGGPSGPYVQSERKDLYRKYAEELVEKGAAYYCFCTPERLDALREEARAKGEQFKYDKCCAKLSPEEVRDNLEAGMPYVIRQNVPTEGATSYNDLIYGEVSVPNADMEDNVLLKSDGYPTYNLANVVDDHLMGITHVIRGQEYLSSTPKYNLLYDALGWEKPQYIHLPPVMRDKQNKLSKRHGDASYQDFAGRGYLPQAIVNYIALLGWAPPDEEILSLDELAEQFDLSSVSRSPAIFDEDKLRWMNGEYIRRLPKEEFIALARPYFESSLDDPDTYDLALLADMIQPRLETLDQIPEKTAFISRLPEFDPELYRHKKMKVTPEGALGYLRAARPVLEGLAEFTVPYVHDAMMKLVEQLGIKNGQLLYPLRIALTNTAVTPGGGIETAVLLGPEETMRRINLAIENLADYAEKQGA
ncbi:MAG: glutamate--tRNA ligase [Clostridia bacterium]|nr:glutamate--tRNA ligase [Clostridia bacterium]